MLVRTASPDIGHGAIAAHTEEFRATYSDTRVTARDMQERLGILLLRLRMDLDAVRHGSVIDVAERGEDGRLRRVIVF